MGPNPGCMVGGTTQSSAVFWWLTLFAHRCAVFRYRAREADLHFCAVIELGSRSSGVRCTRRDLLLFLSPQRRPKAPLSCPRRRKDLGGHWVVRHPRWRFLFLTMTHVSSRFRLCFYRQCGPVNVFTRLWVLPTVTTSAVVRNSMTAVCDELRYQTPF
jgi:hypothetical protein